MHLDHKIPWQIASAHLNLIRCNRRVTPHRTDLFSRNKTSESSDLNHFRRVFVSTIREFSLTEEKILLPLKSSDQLISDAFLSYLEQRYGLQSHQTNSALHNPLSPNHQSIQYWIHRAGPQHEGYVSGDGDLSDAVKMLVIIAASADGKETTAKQMSKEATSVLLTLSRHPQVPLHTLANIHWGHGFGVELVADFALEGYLLINLVESVLSSGRLHTGALSEKEVSLLEMQSFQRFAANALPDYDYPSQNIPHRAFWTPLGVTDSWAHKMNHGYVGIDEQDMNIIDPLQGENDQVRSGLQQYLKTCFAILYIYDLLLREWYGEDEADAKWSYLIGSFFGMYGCKI